ncbi:MAG: hypothetical protein J6S14_01940 [Clostridia bacterium]|nr:hypothetical protein [Clostridia bacterium]
MDKAKQIYKKYTDNMRFITIIGYVLYLVLCLFLISALLFPLAVALVVPMLLILRKLKLIKFRKHILGVILDDLDAPLYREVIKSSGIGTRNIFWNIQSEFYIGNVRGAIELCEASLKAGAIKKKDLRAVLTLLAGWYFIGGDDEGVASACRRYRELGEPKIKTEQTRRMAKIIANYEAYLSGDYEAILRPTGAKRKGALYPLASSFEEAFIDMKKGESEQARAIFSALAVSAENTVFGMIAKRAVDVIDNGGTYRDAAMIEFEPIDTKETIDNYVKVSKKATKTKRIYLLILVLAVAIMLPGAVKSYISDVDEVVTHAVLKQVYGDVEILDIVSFNLNGEKTEKIFIADVGDQLIVGSKYWNDDGEMMIVTYVRPTYSELEEEGSLIYSFNPRGTSEFVYIKIYDSFVAVFENDHLLCQCYFLTDNTITVIIDDEVIE